MADAISTGIKLASAIETAHRAGTVHRDIKPSNVLVTSYHEPALTDFGIAGRLQEVAAEDEVRISYPWSPPEMLDGRSNGSIASDVYSLGATIWHLLVGRSPFSITGGDNSARALSARILHAAPPPTQRADVPPALDRLLQQTMAKQPSHRPETALDLARSLQRIEAAAGFPRTQIAVEGDRAPVAVAPARDDEPDAPDLDLTQVKPVSVVSASGPRGVTPAAAPKAREPAAPVRRSVLVWAGVAVAVAAAVVIGLVVSGGDPPERDPFTDLTVTTPPPTTSRRRHPTDRRSSTGAAPGRAWSSPGRAPMRASPATPGSGSAPTPARASAPTTPGCCSPGPRRQESVCLQVRLIRGSFASEWAQACVDEQAG